jgi:hypothetical protein
MLAAAHEGRGEPMQKALFPCLMLIVMATVMARQELPPPFPRTNATKLFDNDRLNVWDIVWPSGQPTVMHRHIYDQVGTYYQRGGRVITTPDGETRRSTTQVGSLSTTRKGTTHIEAGTTDPPLRAVFIELKQEKPSGLTPAEIGALVFPREGARRVLDDERVLLGPRVRQRAYPLWPGHEQPAARRSTLAQPARFAICCADHRDAQSLGDCSLPIGPCRWRPSGQR